jgi:peptidoglycan/LPS O-acetylase OafA/YrhL
VIRRVPALDGLRGLAIIGVLYAHNGLLWGLTSQPIALNTALASIANVGGLGVELFFVLSSYLITGILLNTKGSPGATRNFFLRRAVRILPLYYVVLTILLVHQAPGAIAGFEVWYWLNLSNWVMAWQGAFPAHGYLVFWSLGVEEQFYALWPFVVFATGQRQLFRIAVAGIAIALVSRIALVLLGASAVTIGSATPAHFDSLGVGAALAILSRGEHGLRPLVPWARRVAIGTVLIVLGLGVPLRGFPGDHWAMLTFGRVGFAVCFGALLVLAVASDSGGLVRRVAESSILRGFGRYSYCLYLIHAPVGETLRLIAYAWAWPVLIQLGFMAHVAIFATVVLVSFGLAWLSWRYIEAPLLSLRRYFSGPPHAYERALPESVVATASSS